MLLGRKLRSMCARGVLVLHEQLGRLRRPHPAFFRALGERCAGHELCASATHRFHQGWIATECVIHHRSPVVHHSKHSPNKLLGQRTRRRVVVPCTGWVWVRVEGTCESAHRGPMGRSATQHCVMCSQLCMQWTVGSTKAFAFFQS
jgi:hypothetical protein